MKPSKKYLEIHKRESARAAKMVAEFERLQKSYDKLLKAMKYRLESAALNGETVCGHTASITNTHQREIDDFRAAGERFHEKVFGINQDKLLSAIGNLQNSLLDEQMEKGIV